jgi:hypothetical protein
MRNTGGMPDVEVIAVSMVSEIVGEVDPNVGNMLDGLSRIEHENRQVLGKLFRLGKEWE